MGALRDWSQTGPQSRELGGLDRFDWPQAPLCLSSWCSCMFTAGFVHTAAFKCGKKLDHQRKNGKNMSSVVVFINITTLRRRRCIHILTIYQMKRKQLKTNRIKSKKLKTKSIYNKSVFEISRSDVPSQERVICVLSWSVSASFLKTGCRGNCKNTLCGFALIQTHWMIFQHEQPV